MILETGDQRGAIITRWWLRGLGLLWLVDAGLQAQPGMFTMNMISTIMQPNIQGQPAWLATLLATVTHLVGAHIAWWNIGFIAVQTAIGISLLSNASRWNHLGLWLSVIWSVLVWIFGEGLGGVLTGSATLLTGAPGSVALYGWLAVGLLVPRSQWHLDAQWSLLRDGAALLFALAAIAQALPVFWTPIGLSSLFQSNLMMQPRWLATTLVSVVSWTDHYSLWANGLFMAVMATIAWGVRGKRPRRWALGLAGLWLVFIWWAGQGFGMIFTGMGTDPNTVPVIALLFIPAWVQADWSSKMARRVRTRFSEPSSPGVLPSS